MAFPINNAGTATAIGSLPFSVSDTFGGVAFGESWFIYTPTAGQIIFGVQIATDGGVGDTPVVYFYSPTSVDALAPPYAGANPREPAQVALTAGVPVYLKLVAESGTATLTLSIQPQPSQQLSPGNVVVPDFDFDSALPAIAIDLVTGELVRSIPFVTAQCVAQLPSGVVLAGQVPSAVSSDVEPIVFYQMPAFNVIATVSNPISGTDGFLPADDRVSRFFIAKYASTATHAVYVLSNTGVVGANWTLPSSTALAAFGVSVGGLKAYYATAATAAAILSYDLVNSAALPNFVAGVTGYEVADLRVLLDDSVVVAYRKDGAPNDNTIRVVRYDADGVSQATYNVATDQGHNTSLQVYPDDPASFVLRTENLAVTTSNFYHLSASDLSVISEVTVDNFDDGQGRNETDQYFGPSELSTFLVMVGASAPDVPSTTTTPIRWVRVSPTIESDGKRIRHVRLELMLQNGTGTVTGAGTNPLILVRSSDDGGQSWSSYREIDVGRTGEYSVQSHLYQLGSCYRRVYEISGSGPVPYVIVKAWIDGVELDH